MFSSFMWAHDLWPMIDYIVLVGEFPSGLLLSWVACREKVDH